MSLNMLTVLLVVLDLPFALTAPMNIGMTGAAASGSVLWAQVLGGLMMIYPLLAIASIIWSVMLARAHLVIQSLLFAILPLLVVVPIVAIIIIHWE